MYMIDPELENDDDVRGQRLMHKLRLLHRVARASLSPEPVRFS
jgi:hypothetical protein